MGLGGCIIGSNGKETRLRAIYTIWEKYGNGTFKSSELKSILSKDEMGIVNMNRWKYRNIVEHAGQLIERGRAIRLWKLTGYSRMMCREMKR